MISLLKSDFYKLFRTKAFYICGVLAAALSVLGVVLLNSALKSELGIDASLLGYDGLYALTTGTSQVTLFITIMLSMFIPNEFSFGTIKNIASRGISRVNIYFSKIIIGAFISVVYTVFCAGASFAAGSIMWGTGELTRAVYLDISRMLGLFLLAEITLQCIFMMVGFFIRQTGGTVATNLAIIIAVPTIIVQFVNYIVYQVFKVENFSADKYWPSTYLTKYLSLDIAQSDINIGLIVCACYIVISLAAGIFFFWKRDIK
jgi:ABC-2 type transport system permease protein